jgi:hypothetical protein
LRIIVKKAVQFFLEWGIVLLFYNLFPGSTFSSWVGSYLVLFEVCSR